MLDTYVSGCACLGALGDRTDLIANVMPAPVIPAVRGDTPMGPATPAALKPTPAILANSAAIKPRRDVIVLRMPDSDSVLSIAFRSISSLASWAFFALGRSDEEIID